MKRFLASLALLAFASIAPATDYRWEPAAGGRAWLWYGNTLAGCQYEDGTYMSFVEGSEPFEADPPIPCCGNQQLVQAKDPPKVNPMPKRGRGYKPPSPEVSATRHHMSDALHGKKLSVLPVASEPYFDCRKLPVQDQGQCGDCYIFSGTEVAGCAQSPPVQLSAQFMLDCHPELGGCNGGDEWQVAQLILASGCPSAAQYGGLGQNPGQCKSTAGMTMYSISAMGYCTVSAGANSVAKTQDIKNCLKAYGPISTAAASGSDDWIQPSNNGVINGPNANDNAVDHAFIIVGWIDNGSPFAQQHQLPNVASGGYWIAQNQWSTQYGPIGGFMYIPYNAYAMGTEAFWVQASTQPPGPGPGPQPPVTTTYYTMATSAAGVITFTPTAVPPTGVTAQQQVAVQAAIQACNAAANALQAAFPMPASQAKGK